MAVNIKLKRSAVSGSAPTLASLELGELALNTYDGRAFMKKKVGSTETIVELASTSGSILSASYADNAGYASTAGTANFATTAGSAATATSASFSTTASYAQTASYVIGALSASYAQTASYSDNFTVKGTLTAQTIIVQVITSSTDFVTGSTRFGTKISDTHQFTGSVTVSGSLAVNDSNVILTNQTSSMSVLNAQTASYAGNYTLTSSFQSFTSSYLTDSGSSSTRLYNLEQFSGSILNYTASINATIADILVETASLQAATASLNAFSASILSFTSSYYTTSGSVSNRIVALEQFSSSLDATFATDADLNALSSSFVAHTASINAFSASINSYTSSVNSTIAALYAQTASISSYTASINATIADILIETASLQAFSASVLSYTSSAKIDSGSVSTRLVNLETFSSSLDATFATDADLNALSSSFRLYTGSLNAFSASMLSFTASTLINSASFDTRINYLSSSFESNTGSLNSFTASFNAFSSSILNTTASINAFSASILNFTASQKNSNGTFATTGSNVFEGVQTINSNLVVTGSITAQTLVVQTITSSQDFVTGSTKFGSIISNTHQFTGSVSVSGSLAVNNSNVILTNQTASMSVATASYWSGSINNVLSASYALTASHATNVPETASFANNATSASFASTASYVNPLNQNLIITGSVTATSFTGSFSGSLNNLQGTATHIPYFSSSQVLDDSAMYQVGSASIAINQNNVTTAAPEALYVWQPSTTSYNVISGKGNLDNYLQLNIQNTNQGVSASSDVVATANNGNETTNYIDMGINSENYSGPVGNSNDAYLFSTGQDLHIGNATAGQPIQFFAGGLDTDVNRKLQLNANGQHQMTGSLDATSFISSSKFITRGATAAQFVKGDGSLDSTLYTSASVFNNTTSSLQAFSASMLAFTASQRNSNGTFATTGSNIFVGNQTVTGSLSVNGSTNIYGNTNVTGSVNISGSTGTAITANVDTIVFTGSYAQSGSVNIQGTQTITGSLIVSNTITAQTLVVQTITSSVDFVTGSTRFGSSLANTHQFTGSVSVTGSLAVNNSNVILTNQTASMSVATASYWSGSINNVLSASYALTASHATNVPETASFANNATSASYALTASFALNIPLTASFALTASYWSGSIINSQTASYVALAQSASYWSGSIQNAVSAAFANFANSASFATTASFALNAGSGGGGGLSALYIQDEGITQGTASYIDFTGEGVTATVTNGTASIVIPGGGGGTAVQGASVQFSQPTASTTWSINHAINSRTPVVEVYDSNYNVIIPTGIQNPAPYQTNIFFEISQSGYAIISTGGVLSVSGSNAILSQNIAATTWSFNHELNNLYPVFTIFDSNNDVIIPQRIHAASTSSALIYFSSPRIGTAVASIAGPQAFASSSISASFASTASYWSGSINNVLSASFASTASYALNSDKLDGKDSTEFATTGSNVFRGNQTVTGSLITSGSNTLIGTTTLTGSISMSGSIGMVGSITASSDVNIGGVLKLNPTTDPGNFNETSSYLFTSASNTTTGFDLYYRQQNNLVKFKWLEGGISTGLLYGGVISYSGSTIFVKPGSGIISNNNASTGSEISPIFTYVNWGSYTASATYLTSSQNTYLYVDASGSIFQQTSFFNQTQYEQAIPLGRVTHPNFLSITGVGSNVQTTYDSDTQQNDFIRAFGPIKVSGFSINAQTGSLRFGVGDGIAYNLGGFYTQDPNSPSHYESNGFATASIARAWRSGSGVYLDNNGGSFYNAVDPDYWDDGTGTLNTMSAGDWQIQRVFANPVTGRTVVYYGQNVYTTLLNALQYLATDSFTEGEFTAKSLVFVGYLVLKGQTNNLTDTVNNRIINAGIFRNIAGGSAGGSAVAQRLENLSDVIVTTPSNGQALIYDGGNWINGNPVSASFSTTSTTASFVRNAQTASYVLNAVSASFAATSSFITLAQSASFVQNAQSASYWSGSIVNALSSSFASTASYWSGSIVNAATASFVQTAQTASYWSGSINNALSASYAATASYADNFTVAGTLTAQTLVIQTITSSVIYSSGSNKFGNDLANTQQLTGSVSITGSLAVNGSNVILTNQTASMSVATASFASTASYWSGSINNAVSSSFASTASYWSGSINNVASASFASTASYWSGSIVNAETASFVQTAQTASFVQTAQTASYWSGSINNVASASFASTASYWSGSIQNATSASFATNANSSSYALTASFALNGGGGGISAISIADEGILLGSASYFDFTGAGVSTIVNAGTASFTISGGGSGTQGLTTTFTQSSAAVSWSFTHNLNTRTPVVQVYDSGYNQITPQYISSSDASTVVIGFGIATTGYAVISTGGALVVTGSNVILNQTASATTWSFNHGLNTQYPVFQVFDSNDEVIVPERIKAVDSASALIYFPLPVSGKAVASFAGLSGSIGGGSGAGFPFSGSAVITGSFLVSGSFVDFTNVGSFTGNLTGTASYATFALTASTAPGYTVQFSQTASATTWSFTHNMGTRNPIVQVYDTNYKQIVPNDIVGIDGSTAEIRFDYAQAGYAVMSNGGGLYITGSTSTLIQTSAATTWSFNHRLNTKYPAFEVYDSNDFVIIPANIRAVDVDNAELHFASAQAGRAIANFSGINGLQDNAVSASYASSGSVFHVDKVVMDRSLMDFAQVNSSIVGSNNMFTQATGSYTSMFVNYTVSSGSNARSGQIIAVWNAGTTEYNDVSTNDIGNTSAVTGSVSIVSGEAQLNFQTNTSAWRIKSTATFM